MPTPQITMRVDTERLARWKVAVAKAETSVSEQIRLLMDQWAASTESKGV